MPELVLPTTRLHAAFLECLDDWGPGLHEDGFGIGNNDDLDSPAGFAAWVRDQVRLTHPAIRSSSVTVMSVVLGRCPSVWT